MNNRIIYRVAEKKYSSPEIEVIKMESSQNFLEGSGNLSVLPEENW